MPNQPTDFKKQLQDYRQAIDADIQTYAAEVQKIIPSQFGEYGELEVNTFLDILARGGKRIRGALTMVGYEMCGGQNRAMILQAARAIEMFHASLLIFDDIQDRSAIRRGKPSAHQMLAAYHKKHNLKGDAAHSGVSLAINAAISGSNAAQMILANLDADPQLKLNAIGITNRTLAITVHGQTCDIMNEIVPMPTDQDIRRVLEWKTAQYSFVNPLHVGMVLAGAGCKETTAITPFATNLGMSFQITDDILGVYGDKVELGKSPMDDIREGKGTLMMTYALQHAAAKDRDFLQNCLGNPELTEQDFARCREIVEKSGAKNYAQNAATHECQVALKDFESVKHLWNESGVVFLEGLANYLLGRSS